MAQFLYIRTQYYDRNATASLMNKIVFVYASEHLLVKLNPFSVQATLVRNEKNKINFTLCDFFEFGSQICLQGRLLFKETLCLE